MIEELSSPQNEESRLSALQITRICLAVILITVCLGALALTFQDNPYMYFFFVVIGGVGVYIAMLLSW